MVAEQSVQTTAHPKRYPFSFPPTCRPQYAATIRRCVYPQKPSLMSYPGPTQKVKSVHWREQTVTEKVLKQNLAMDSRRWSLTSPRLRQQQRHRVHRNQRWRRNPRLRESSASARMKEKTRKEGHHQRGRRAGTGSPTTTRTR